MLLSILVAWPLLVCSPLARSQTDTSREDAVAVSLERKGPMFALSATGFVRAAQHQAWEVLTDYDHLQEFVPDLRSSALRSRNGEVAVVEQRSESGFLFVSQEVRLLVRITEQPYSVIDVALIDGDMRSYSTRWELQPSVEQGVTGTRINFSGTMEPDFFIPPLVGTAIVRSNVKRMVDAVLKEIERRNGGARE